VLTRLFWGTRVVVALAPISVLLGILMGAPLGLISGYVGGALDTLIMRGSDIIYSFPMLLIQILIITSMPPSVLIVIISVAIGNVPVIARIVRSLALDERTKDYVNAARLRGERRSYIAAGNPAQCERADHRRCHHPDRVRDHVHRLSGLPRIGHTTSDAGLGRDDQ